MTNTLQSALGLAFSLCKVLHLANFIASFNISFLIWVRAEFVKCQINESSSAQATEVNTWSAREECA